MTYRREFLKAIALAAPANLVVPCFSRLAAQERGRVKITDVKVMRIRMKGHAMPLVKIETDAGVHGIGECHHDITGLGAKDAVLNAFREMLIGQDPFDIDKLTTHDVEGFIPRRAIMESRFTASPVIRKKFHHCPNRVRVTFRNVGS